MRRARLWEFAASPLVLQQSEDHLSPRREGLPLARSDVRLRGGLPGSRLLLHARNVLCLPPPDLERLPNRIVLRNAPKRPSSQKLRRRLFKVSVLLLASAERHVQQSGSGRAGDSTAPNARAVKAVACKHCGPFGRSKENALCFLNDCVHSACHHYRIVSAAIGCVETSIYLGIRQACFKLNRGDAAGCDRPDSNRAVPLATQHYACALVAFAAHEGRPL